MTERDKNRILAVAIGVLMTLIALCCLTSCAVRKTVTETLYVHDTTYVSHYDSVHGNRVVRDSVIDWRVNFIHDTLHHEIERVIVLNEKGDTIRQREIERLWEKFHDLQSSLRQESRTDSTSYLKTQNDSLRAVLKEHEKQQKTVTKKEPPWKWICVSVLCIMAFVVVLRSK